MRLKIESYGISDIGLVRQNNEDVWVAIPKYNFFALADGMGGHKAGEVAAKEAIAKLCESFQRQLLSAADNASIDQIILFLRQAIREANIWVYEMSKRNEDMHGMGTTLCCMTLQAQTLIYAHVGDSRIYRFRKYLQQLTSDHSLRSELIATGHFDKENVALYAYKNIITRAIGTALNVEPDIAQTEIEAGDIYFLCSDGLTDYVASEEISATLSTAGSIKQACDELVELAKEKGGNDNITIVMIKTLL